MLIGGLLLLLIAAIGAAYGGIVIKAAPKRRDNVMFGLLAGGEIYGLPGVFVALPMLAVFRELWEFFSERFALAEWPEDEALPVEVDVEAPSPPRAVGSG